jgi:hypothetical protein
MTHRDLFILSLFGLMAGICSADPEHTVTLTWQPAEVSESLSATLDDRPFAKEPDLAGHKVLRGALAVGENRSERLGLLWDKDQGRLYLDLNRDGDLTNDPNNAWDRTEEGSRTSSILWHRFNGVRVALVSDSNAPAVFDVVLNDYGSFRQANFTLRSAYSGTVDLHGQAWTLTLADTNLDGRIDRSDRLRLPGTQSIDPGGSMPSVTVPDEVFVGGSDYELILDAFPKVTFRHLDVPMGTLEVKAKGIENLHLDGSGRLVWLSLSAESARIPAGEYTCVVADLVLKARQTVQPRDLNKVSVNVPENGTGQIAIGCPLHHYVEASRSGRVLSLSYQLRGEGGERYDLRTLLSSSKAPTFKVYKGGTVVGSGRFEFG